MFTKFTIPQLKKLKRNGTAQSYVSHISEFTEVLVLTPRQSVQSVEKRNWERRQMMKQELNLDHKRVCDISTDLKVVEIRKKDCITTITANPDGTLNIAHKRIQVVA